MLAAAGLTSSAPPQTVSCDPRAKKAQHCLGTPELQKGQNSKAGTALDKILFRIWYLCWNLTFILIARRHLIPRQPPHLSRDASNNDYQNRSTRVNGPDAIVRVFCRRLLQSSTT